VTITLDEFQVESRAYLRDRNIAWLFDEPGYGKTHPTIFAGHDRYIEGRPNLLTVPAYLIPNWIREIQRSFPDAKVVAANGDDKDSRHAAFDSDAHFILTSYNNWSTYDKLGPHDNSQKVLRYMQLQKRRWSSMAFDECHRLRGRNSIWTKELYKTRNVDAKNRETPLWGLTGTPLVRDPGDIYPLLHLSNRDVFSSYWTFVETWCQITQTPWEKEVGQLLPGLEERFWKMVMQYSMRRLTKDHPILSQLEDIELPPILVDLPVSVYASMARLKKEYILSHPDLEHDEYLDSGGALYNKLRELTTRPPTQANPKVEALLDRFQDIPVAERVVVYTWYRDTATMVQEVLHKRLNPGKEVKRPVLRCTGDDTDRQIDERIQQWSATPGAVIVANIARLKEGVNLQAGNRILFLEETELPGDMDQCVRRLKRRGQLHPVYWQCIRANRSEDLNVARDRQLRAEGIDRATLRGIRKDRLMGEV